MSADPLAAFADLTPPGTAASTTPPEPSDTYPGSKQRRRAVAGPRDTWAAQPHVDLVLRGESVRFYPVGVLADKLERKPPAIRKWERAGYLPDSGFRTPGRTVHGQRRLYTRAQIEGLVDIAREEGLLGESIRNVSATEFPVRAEKLFKELAL